MDFDLARFNMVEQQIRPWQVLDPVLLEVLLQVKRELFTPEQYRDIAYSDTEIPLGNGRVMLAPCVQARLIHDLQLRRADKVLEIGTASGYATAVLALMCKRVISIESNAELALTAMKNLQKSSIGNAEVRVSSELQGSPAEGPFDAIILQGSVPEIPEQLLSQLQIGGHLIAVVGEEPMMQVCKVTRHGPQSFNYKNLWDTIAPRIPGVREPSHFQL